MQTLSRGTISIYKDLHCFSNVSPWVTSSRGHVRLGHVLAAVSPWSRALLSRPFIGHDPFGHALLGRDQTTRLVTSLRSGHVPFCSRPSLVTSHLGHALLSRPALVTSRHGHVLLSPRAEPRTRWLPVGAAERRRRNPGRLGPTLTDADSVLQVARLGPP